MPELKPPVGTIVRRKMMANGNIRVEIEYEATEDLRCAQLFPHGSSVIAVPITTEAAKDATTEAFIAEEVQPENLAKKLAGKGPYSATAQALHRSGFYNSRNVQRALCADDSKGAELEIKILFGVISMTHVHPFFIKEWAENVGVWHSLPLEVREWVKPGE